MSAPLASDAVLDVARLDAARVASEPFAFLVADHMLPADADGRAALDRDFPRYDSAGFFPYRAEDCGPSVVALVDQLTSPAFARALGEKLGLPGLGDKPALVTICRHLNRRHGTIHTDSRSKLATALVYLPPEWPHGSAGALRFLRRIDSIDELVAPEVPPVYGTLAAFRRADNSFHGHLPFEGERRVIQVAWLTSHAELERKTRRGGFSRWLKGVLGRLDARWGAGRADDARHT